MKTCILLLFTLIHFAASADLPDDVATVSQNETEGAATTQARMYINCDDLHRNSAGDKIRMRPHGIPPEGMSMTEYGSLFQFLCRESGVGQVVDKRASIQPTLNSVSKMLVQDL
jgi:hypothetical protein